MTTEYKQEHWSLGDEFGIDFPTRPEQLLLTGPDFLTKALRATGAISAANAVLSIENWKEVVAGGMGRKASFDVTYAIQEPNLHTALFAKFEIDEDNPIFESFSGVMFSEIQFAILSRKQDFPVQVPSCYYADANEVKRHGLLITERIAFGENGLVPELEKAKDFELDNCIEYYQAIMRALGKIAAFDRLNGFGPDSSERLTPKVGTPDLFQLDKNELNEKIDALIDFANNNPRIFTDDVWDSKVAADLKKWLPYAAYQNQTMQDALKSYELLNNICHWNPHLDNAWFWRDENGVMQAGLLDWGNVGKASLAMSFVSAISCCEPEFIAEHQSGLVEELLTTYEKEANVTVDRQDFADSCAISLGCNGLETILPSPEWIMASIPNYQDLEGRFDARLVDEFLPRALIRVLVFYFYAWKTKDIASTLERLFGSEQ